MSKMPGLTITPRLRELLTRPHGTDPNIISIQAPPGSGKSTKLVPEIWKLKTGSLGIYLVPTFTEAKLLSSHLCENDIPSKAERNLLQLKSTTTSNLIICAYHAFRELLANPVEPGHTPLTFFLDVELVPTPAGEILLGKVIEYVRYLQRLDRPSTTIVLLGSHIRVAIHRTLEKFLGVVVESVDFNDLPDPISVINFEKGNPYHWLVQKLQTHFATKGASPFSIALFMNHTEAREHVLGLVNTRALNIEMVGPHTQYTSVVEAIADEKAKLICIHPDVPYTIPPIRDLALVVSSGTRKCRVFDEATGQFVQAQLSLSLRELRKQRSILESSTHPRRAFMILQTAHWYSQLSKDPPRASGILLEMILEVLHAWPRADVANRLANIPVPLISDVPGGLYLEVRRRLMVAGAVQGNLDSGCQTTRLGSLTVAALQNPLDWSSEWHMANLTARIALAREGGLTDSALRVLLRLVMVVCCKPHSLYSLTAPGTQARDNGNLATLLSKVKSHCDGAGAAEMHMGSIWLALGLYEGLVANDSLRDYSKPQFVCVADGLVRLNRDTARRMFRYIQSLERKYSLVPLAPHTATEPLSETERLQVYELLIWSHFHHIVFIPNVLRPKPIDMTSLQPVEMAAEAFVPLDIDKLVAGSTTGPIPAFYLEAKLRDDGIPVLTILDLNLIPSQVLHNVQKSTGKKLSEMLVSVYRATG